MLVEQPHPKPGLRRCKSGSCSLSIRVYSPEKKSNFAVLHFDNTPTVPKDPPRRLLRPLLKDTVDTGELLHVIRRKAESAETKKQLAEEERANRLLVKAAKAKMLQVTKRADEVIRPLHLRQILDIQQEDASRRREEARLKVVAQNRYHWQQVLLKRQVCDVDVEKALRDRDLPGPYAALMNFPKATCPLDFIMADVTSRREAIGSPIIQGDWAMRVNAARARREARLDIVRFRAKAAQRVSMTVLRVGILHCLGLELHPDLPAARYQRSKWESGEHLRGCPQCPLDLIFRRVAYDVSKDISSELLEARMKEADSRRLHHISKIQARAVVSRAPCEKMMKAAQEHLSCGSHPVDLIDLKISEARARRAAFLQNKRMTALAMRGCSLDVIAVGSKVSFSTKKSAPQPAEALRLPVTDPENDVPLDLVESGHITYVRDWADMLESGEAPSCSPISSQGTVEFPEDSKDMESAEAKDTHKSADSSDAMECTSQDSWSSHCDDSFTSTGRPGYNLLFATMHIDKPDEATRVEGHRQITDRVSKANLRRLSYQRHRAPNNVQSRRDLVKKLREKNLMNDIRDFSAGLDVDLRQKLRDHVKASAKPIPLPDDVGIQLMERLRTRELAITTAKPSAITSVPKTANRSQMLQELKAVAIARQATPRPIDPHSLPPHPLSGMFSMIISTAHHVAARQNQRSHRGDLTSRDNLIIELRKRIMARRMVLSLKGSHPLAILFKDIKKEVHRRRVASMAVAADHFHSRIITGAEFRRELEHVLNARRYQIEGDTQGRHQTSPHPLAAMFPEIKREAFRRHDKVMKNLEVVNGWRKLYAHAPSREECEPLLESDPPVTTPPPAPVISVALPREVPHPMSTIFPDIIREVYVRNSKKRAMAAERFRDELHLRLEARRDFIESIAEAKSNDVAVHNTRCPPVSRADLLESIRLATPLVPPTCENTLSRVVLEDEMKMARAVIQKANVKVNFGKNALPPPPPPPLPLKVYDTVLPIPSEHPGTSWCASVVPPPPPPPPCSLRGSTKLIPSPPLPPPPPKRVNTLILFKPSTELIAVDNGASEIEEEIVEDIDENASDFEINDTLSIPEIIASQDDDECDRNDECMSVKSEPVMCTRPRGRPVWAEDQDKTTEPFGSAEGNSNDTSVNDNNNHVRILRTCAWSIPVASYHPAPCFSKKPHSLDDVASALDAAEHRRQEAVFKRTSKLRQYHHRLREQRLKMIVRTNYKAHRIGESLFNKLEAAANKRKETHAVRASFLQSKHSVVSERCARMKARKLAEREEIDNAQACVLEEGWELVPEETIHPSQDIPTSTISSLVSWVWGAK